MMRDIARAAEAAGQRAIEHALARAAELDRTADALLTLNMVEPAERLAHRAAELREVAA